MIERYSLKFNGGQAGLFPVADGEYVRYADHEREVKRLTAETETAMRVAYLRARLEQVADQWIDGASHLDDGVFNRGGAAALRNCAADLRELARDKAILENELRHHGDGL